ncbi:MAG: lysophospholipid acyltransferase family protein [Elusimicrobiota bacterium]
MNESTHSSPLHSFLPFLAHLYILFTGATTRLKWKNRPENSDFIYTLWHSQLAFMLYSHRGMGISVLVSKSADGEYMARVLRKFGHNTVRGSTSRGASQSLMELIERAGAGCPVAITPDGPKGPKGKVQQGVIYLAQKTGMKILPAGVGLSHKITFNSWDNFEFPLPFGKAAIVYGNPISVSETDSIPAKTEELEQALNSLGAEALGMIK